MAGTDRGQDRADPKAPQPAVVLVRPQIGENVGAAARAMLNFGLTDLRLAAPVCAWPNAKAVNAASGASVVLNEVDTFASTRAAVGDLQWVCATTARPREMIKPVLTAVAAAEELRARLAAGLRVGILFGPERTGLENDEVALADAVVTIPLNPGFASLNLAQAVVLVAYEYFQAGDSTPAVQDDHERLGRASKADITSLLDHMVRELDGTSFFRSDDRRERRIQELELLLHRRELRVAEIHTLRGVVKALTQERRPARRRQSV